MKPATPARPPHSLPRLARLLASEWFQPETVLHELRLDCYHRQERATVVGELRAALARRHDRKETA